MTLDEEALKSVNEVVGWAREDVAAGKPARAIRRLDSAISDGEREIAAYSVREPFPGSLAAVKAAQSVLVAARAEVA
jgi:hypothetical protein